MDLWLFRDRITLSAHWYSCWKLRDVGLLTFHYNGWRPRDRTLDATCRILKLNLNIIVWNMPFADPRRARFNNDGL